MKYENIFELGTLGYYQGMSMLMSAGMQAMFYIFNYYWDEQLSYFNMLSSSKE